MSSPSRTTIRIARRRFAEQLPKSRLDRGAIAEASVSIAPDGSTGRVCVGRGDIVDARGLTVRASLRLATGAELALARTILVAPHDARRELRRHPAPQ